MDDQRHASAPLLPGKRSGTHFTGGCVAPKPVWKGAKNLTPMGFDTQTHKWYIVVEIDR